MEKEIDSKFKPNVKGEMDEIKRVSQYLTRHEDFPVSVDDVKNALKGAEEVTLTDEVWEKLENTESNKISKGEFEKVLTIAKHYNKSNPYKLRMKLVDDTYQRPMIVKFGDRYHLVSGNTRLSTAASMGMNPKVFIGDLNNDKDYDDIVDITESNVVRLNESMVYTEQEDGSLVFDVDDTLPRVKTLFDTLGKASASQLKYLGVKDDEQVSKIMVAYHGGIEKVEEKIINDIESYNFGEPFSMICGGYHLFVRFDSYEVDDATDFDIDIMLDVSLGEDSDVDLFDGSYHMIKDIMDDGYKWAEENGYSHSVADEILMEMEECIRERYSNNLNLKDKYGVEIYTVRIIGMF